MLVLSRKEGESIEIGEGPNKVIVTLVSLRGDKARFGIEAAREIPVHRSEVAAAIAREGQDRSGDAA